MLLSRHVIDVHVDPDNVTDADLTDMGDLVDEAIDTGIRAIQENVNAKLAARKLAPLRFEVQT